MKSQTSLYLFSRQNFLLVTFLQAYNVLIILGRMAQQFVLEKTTEMYSKKLRTLALS